MASAAIWCGVADVVFEVDFGPRRLDIKFILGFIFTCFCFHLRRDGIVV